MKEYLFILLMTFFGISFKIIDYLYHKDKMNHADNFSEEISYTEARKIFKQLIYKKQDNYTAFLLYLSCYLFIFSSILLSKQIHNLLMDFVCILFVAGRVRSLQELGHYSVHFALCPNSKLGILFANIMYQYPWHMPSAQNRRKIHAKEHHHRVNMENDPDLQELKEKNLTPGISAKQFWKGVFYPLTPIGIWQRLKEIYLYYKSGDTLEKFNRIICTLSLIGLIYTLDSWHGVILFYFIPLIIIYPLFYWLAHLALHRWYADCPDTLRYYEREILLGRPTNFTGIIGWIIKINIFPYGDSYHLAHSLFPMIRWNYLSKIDTILKNLLKGYKDHQSNGLIFQNGHCPSALSELKNRLVRS